MAMLGAALVSVGVLITTSVPGLAASSRQVPKTTPTLVPAGVLTPAPSPSDERKIAILQLLISSAGDGQVESVKLQQGRIIRRYAPYVLDMSGPWTVELVSDKNEIRKFGTLDPRLVRVYSEEGKAHTTILEAQITWELVVPLYDRGIDLHVRQIIIRDDTSRPVFATLVNPDKGTFEQIQPPNP